MAPSQKLARPTCWNGNRKTKCSRGEQAVPKKHLEDSSRAFAVPSLPVQHRPRSTRCIPRTWRDSPHNPPLLHTPFSRRCARRGNLARQSELSMAFSTYAPLHSSDLENHALTQPPTPQRLEPGFHISFRPTGTTVFVLYLYPYLQYPSRPGARL